jgi:preprotein translocase subunit SecA
MDYLREGIGLRAMAQRDPLVEYQREGGDMFNAMMEAFMEEVVGFVFHLDVEVEEAPAVGVVTDGTGQPLTVGAVSTNGEGRHDGSPQQQNGRREARRASRLIESGPDPDGPGVEAHVVSDPRVDENDEESEVEELETAFHRPTVKAKGLSGAPRRAMTYSAPDEDGAATTTTQAGQDSDEFAGVGRNAPCPCGSGKKFKMCHGRSGAR